MTEFFPIAVITTLLILGYTFFVRAKDIPETPEPSPSQHLETRKAAIYENLRDLQFEYRVGKLSDDDYQRTKAGLQSELAGVLAEIDRLKSVPKNEVDSKKVSNATLASTVCPHCNATFEKPLRFCGECGKAMVKTA